MIQSSDNQTQQQQANHKESVIYKAHMWTYCFEINGNRATRNSQNCGYYPMATHEPLKPTGVSKVSIRAKVTEGELRFGVSNQKNVYTNSWTRDQFLYLDGNQGRQGKNSAVSYNIKQLGENAELLASKEQILLRMEVNMTTRTIAWYIHDRLLIKLQLPNSINNPMHPFFSLRNNGDWCEYL